MYEPVSSKNAIPIWFILLNLVSVSLFLVASWLTCYVKNLAIYALINVTGSMWLINTCNPLSSWLESNGALLFFKQSYIKISQINMGM